MFDFLVIGAGMIGAAAARYLSAESVNVALVGPNEPTNWDTHQGVFSSHYDSGRITRVLDKDLVWGSLANQSIAAYAEIERRSGIQFHHAVGGVVVGEAEYVEANAAVGEALGADFGRFSPTQPPAAMCIQFPDGLYGVHERGQAGYINPRKLVAAQLAICHQQGTTLVDDEVVAIKVQDDCVVVRTQSGSELKARKVVMAAGAYSRFLLPRKLKMLIKPRTVAMAWLDSTESQRLANMPTIIYVNTEAESIMEYFYSVPPTVYPDGNTYLKIGGAMPDLVPAESQDDLTAWFNRGGNPREAELLKEYLYETIPDFQPLEIIAKPCVVVDTAHSRPYIDVLIDERLYVAAGGNGAAAKSSDAIGRLGALLASGQWDDAYSRNDFRAIYDD